MPNIEELQLLNHVLSEKSMDVVDELGLNEEYFPIHKDTYLFIREFKNRHGNIPTVETVLNKFDNFELVEPENVVAVVDSLKEDWLHRQFKPLLLSASHMVGDKKTTEALQLIRTGADRLLQVADSSVKGYSYIGEADARKESYLRIHGRSEDEILGISTGFHPLDVATNGLESGEGAVDYFLVFAPTHMGKTLISSFMMQAGWTATPQWDYPAYFALEQTAAEIAYNWDNTLANVSRLAIVRGTMSDDMRDQYIDFLDRLKNKKKDIKIYDTEFFRKKIGRLPTVNDIRSLIESEGHTRFALDQLSKVTPASITGDLRQQLHGVSRDVREMILGTKIPGYVVAQANRDSAKRVKKDSTSGVDGEDIGEAYAIQQDASKSISIVKVDDNTFRITVTKNRGNACGQTFLVRYNFDTGMVHTLNENSGEQFF